MYLFLLKSAFSKISDILHVSCNWAISILFAHFWFVEKKSRKESTGNGPFMWTQVGISQEQKVFHRSQCLHSIISNKIYNWDLVTPLLFQVVFTRILRNLFSLTVPAQSSYQRLGSRTPLNRVYSTPKNLQIQNTLGFFQMFLVGCNSKPSQTWVCCFAKRKHKTLPMVLALIHHLLKKLTFCCWPTVLIKACICWYSTEHSF